MRIERNSDGYIAILSVLILSVVMFLIASSLSTSSFFTRFGKIDYESREISYYLSRSCIEHAMLEFVKDSNYVGDETIDVDTYTCNIGPVTGTAPLLTFTTTGTVDESTTRFKVDVDNSYIDIISMREI